MKKFLLKFLALSSLILAGCSSALAVTHTMSKKEHKEFLAQINTIIENYVEDNKRHLKSIKGNSSAVRDYTSSFSVTNDAFDKEHGFDVSDLDLSHCEKTFEEAATLCYEHVLDRKAFAKQPFCCRGMSLFVLKYLTNKEIKCSYIQFTIKNPVNPRSSELHDVVAYHQDGKWYICDLGRALVYYIFENYAPTHVKSKCRELYGYTNPLDILSVPYSDYQAKYVANPKNIRLFCVERMLIDRTGWHMFNFDKIKMRPACEILDHFNSFEPMNTEELKNYYGVDTPEELEGKSPEELKSIYEKHAL